jgi:hypothetical protein
MNTRVLNARLSPTRCLLGLMLPLWLAGVCETRGAEGEAFDLGQRRELFVDQHRIESLTGSARLVLHPPQPAEIALTFDAPWEGPVSTYVTVFRDGDRVRMYYRGYWNPPEFTDQDTGHTQASKQDGLQFACLAESTDGKTFTRPSLGVVEFNGSKDNNIVLGHRSHNFAPFKDERPDVPDDERYKALMTKGTPFPGGGVSGGGLAGLVSHDGIHWRPAASHPVMSVGPFDSQNVAFWDPNYHEYRSYFRRFPNRVRSIGWARSSDFRQWSEAQLIDLGEPPSEQFYTNATLPYFRAPHYYFSFPKRLVTGRSGLPGHSGISDAVFLSSRDGVRFDRTFREALIRPGRDRLNWGDRSIMPAWGLIQTGADEMSIYYTEHYRYPTARVRRGVWRLDGIASLHADAAPGELVTRPFTCSGNTLTLNYATSAAGGIRIEIQDPAGKPIPGFALADAPEAFGDQIDVPYRWKQGTDLSPLAGRPIRLRILLHDADLYSYRFTTDTP